MTKGILKRWKMFRIYGRIDLFNTFNSLFDIRIYRPWQESIFHISLSILRCRFVLGVDKNREYYNAR